MKVLTLNFLTCAVKSCKSSSDSFPLHPKDAELVSDDVELNPQLLVNLLPRIDWKALRTTSTEASTSLKLRQSWVGASRSFLGLLPSQSRLSPCLVFVPLFSTPHLLMSLAQSSFPLFLLEKLTKRHD